VRGSTHSHYNRRFTDRHGKVRHTVGWEFVHIAIDDCTRLAYAEVLTDEKDRSARRANQPGRYLQLAVCL
jgi:hypothetical protein